MTNLSPLNSRSFLPTSLPSANAQDGKNLRSSNSSLAEKAQNDLVSLSKNGIDLQQRVDTLGNSTVDLAQNLIGTFAQQMFGDDLKGATISFDSVDLETSSSFAAGVQQSSGSGGVSNAAAFSLTESSHFLGKGTITTADGRKFDFEVEVQYDYSLEAAAGQTTSAPADSKAPRSAADPLPEIQFPDIRFPGSLQDLFRLFDKPLKSDLVDQKSEEKLGTLSLRLLNLVNKQESLDTYTQPGEKNAKAVANAYGRTEPSLPEQAAAPAQANAEARAAEAAAEAPAPEPTPAPDAEPAA
ncbi:hypothetical protein [Pseudoduganella namucuonensis]|uniref:Uncharacterized protein n=1 Tax=Pseudoduganella namucuonensis TaxID=1035707 RepID=A0A1I7LFI7_9BURK|nr:hypothetical protein [Pseudoduganella namucuonensis]SFV08459.1 hypothetical protein SAMN05216552_102873 [Pseudoduganella namucuonensis]